MRTKQIIISDEADNKLMNECSALFLKAHPELKGIRLSRNFMVWKLIEYYLK